MILHMRLLGKNLIEANQNLFQLTIDENSQIFIKDFTDSDIQEFSTRLLILS